MATYILTLMFFWEKPPYVFYQQGRYQSSQRLALNTCQPHHRPTPLSRGLLPPHPPSTQASPTALPSRSSTNYWQQTQCWLRLTSAEGRTAILGYSFHPSNMVVLPTPPLSARPTREERQPYQNGRHWGRISASSDKTSRRGACTTSAGWSTPPWRTRSFPSSNTYTCRYWKICTHDMPPRWS